MRFDSQRRAAAKRAFTTRRCPIDDLVGLALPAQRAVAGDLVLARVARIGHHQRLQLVTGRAAQLYLGDEIIVCYGHRYAPDQFEATIGGPDEPLHLAAGGGIAATVRSAHSRMRPPTGLEEIGRITGADGRPVNVGAYGLPERRVVKSVPVIAVAGTAMNAGKTTTAANLVCGLARAGWKVGAAKLTGTGAGGDLWAFADAGAGPVLDFTDAGHATTFRLPLAALEGAVDTLFGELQAQGAEVIVAEIADGPHQPESAELLRSRRFARWVDAMLFASHDACGAADGALLLRELGLPLKALSGTLSGSPLASREAAAYAGVPVLDLDALSDPTVVEHVLPVDAEPIRAAS